MKRKIQGIYIFFLILLLVSCGKDKETLREKDDSLTEYCKSYIDSYEVEAKENGYIVTIVSPDFAKLAEMILYSEENIKLDDKILMEIIQKNPQCKKEYKIELDVVNDEKIAETYYEQISYELIREMITSTEITIEWGNDE